MEALQARIFVIFALGTVLVLIMAFVELRGRLDQQDDATDMRASRVLTAAMVLSRPPGQVLKQPPRPLVAARLDLADEDFDARVFLESIRSRFLDILAAVRRSDLSGVEPFLDERARSQLNSRIRFPSGPPSESEIRAVVPLALEVSGAIETVRVWVELETYRLARASGTDTRLGGPTPGFKTAEVWTLVRQRPPAGTSASSSSRRCPHCGAPLPMAVEERCPFCDERVKRALPEAYGWRLHDIVTEAD